ncbi:hypothetical protein [Cesiribacter andamanensis]|uniref:Uncharacterized protein n=1 Tax=Cesiribacter andamanensis AMV16 TaxID=1279009 RepID=M7N8Z5_9BACT|nr:hypothetical protein [Cesiribacter andamanensis]EMR03681.1 hypothetical protein ADICEAN_01202 [Cesiribacter andamanensis AMV16]
MAYNIYTNLFYGQPVSRAKSLSEPHKTTDTSTIRTWAEARGGKPALRAAEHQQTPPELCICFADSPQEAGLEEISWERFFTEFEDHRFVMVYREQETDGELSHFYRLMLRRAW